MALPNLTRDQAVERAALVTVDSYRIALDLTDGEGKPGERTFRSMTTVEFDALAGADTYIDIAADSIRSATLNGRDIDVSGYDESTGIPLTGLAEHNVLVVDADCRYSNTGEGLHRFVDPVDGEVYLYSQFETADAKRMFACFDQPDLKADVRHHGDRAAALGGHLQRRHADTCMATATHMTAHLRHHTADEHLPRRADRGAVRALGRHLLRRARRHPARPVSAARRWPSSWTHERLFTETKQGFGFYHKNFGVPYAFGKYDQLFVPEFNAGAMENAGAVTFLEDYVFRSKVTRASYERRAETVLHEMAHMWFGDLVTMQWWDDLWLNESFATFASVLCQAEATEFTEAWTTFANVEKSWAYRQDQLPSTHPVAADIPDLAAVEVNFDGITYAKGASVLKQLVAYVGLEEFLAGLRDYFRDHAFGNATFGDLLGALEKASGRDLSGWGQQWLKTTGLNTLRPDFDLDADGRFTRFAITQSGAQPGAGETRVHRLAVGIYDDDGSGKLVRTHREELDVEGAVTGCPCAAGCFARQADPGQRRRPDVLLAAPRPRVVADGAHPHRRHRRPAAPHPRVVGGVGDDPRSRTEGPRLRVAGLRRRAGRNRGRRGAAAAAASPDGAERHTPTRRGPAREAGRLSPTGCWSWPAAPSRGRITSWRTSTRCAIRCCRTSHIDGAGRRCSTPIRPTLGLAGLEVDTDLRWRIVTALAAAGVDRCRRAGDTVHRRRGGAGSDRSRRAACRGGVGGATPGRGQGGSVAAGDRGRHAGQHHRAVDHRRVRAARPA